MQRLPVSPEGILITKKALPPHWNFMGGGGEPGRHHLRGHVPSVVSFPQIQNPPSNPEKTPHHTSPQEETFYGIRDQCPSNTGGHEAQGNPEQLELLGRDNKNPTADHNLGSWTGSCNGKRALPKNLGKSGSSLS